MWIPTNTIAIVIIYEMTQRVTEKQQILFILFLEEITVNHFGHTKYSRNVPILGSHAKWLKSTSGQSSAYLFSMRYPSTHVSSELQYGN